MGKKYRKQTKLRFPPPESIAARAAGKVVTISRERAIVGLLDTAIPIWLADGDIGSVHILSMAAWKTLHDIGKKSGKGPMSEKFFPDLAWFTTGYDFLRHASSETNVELDIPVGVNEVVMWDAINSFDKIFGRKSAIMATFAAWFALHPPFDSQLLPENSDVFLPTGVSVEQVRNLNRGQFFARILPLFGFS